MTNDNIVMRETRLSIADWRTGYHTKSIVVDLGKPEKIYQVQRRNVPCSMRLSLFRTSAARRARVLSLVCCCFLFSLRLVQGGWEGALRGAGVLFFWLEPWPTARSHVGVLGSWRVLATNRFEITGARTSGEPSGAHRDRRAVARDTAGGPGRYTNTGMVLPSTGNAALKMTENPLPEDTAALVPSRLVPRKGGPYKTELAKLL